MTWTCIRQSWVLPTPTILHCVAKRRNSRSMSQQLNIHFFAHSWVSDWNHGNAHFLRGLARALMKMGHKVKCYEQLGSWSLSNLVKNEGERAITAIDEFRRVYPDLNIHFYNNDSTFPDFAAHHLR